MAADRSIGFNIFATDKASASFDKVARSATGVGTAVAGANKSHLNQLGASLAVGAAGAVAFGVSAVNSFKAAGSETVKLQKAFGGTVEDASRLRFAAKDTGVDVDTLAKGLQKASVAAVNNSPAFGKLGIATRDASGHVKSMGQLLPELTDKFSKMQAGPQKTAAIMAIFGKSGMALTPILNKNSGALADLGKKSDQYGQTLSGKALSAMKNSAQAQRDQKLAMDGVKVQLGGALMPIFADFAKLLSTKIVPAIVGIVDWLKKHKDIVIGVVAVLGTLFIATKAVSAATTAYHTVTSLVSAATKVWSGIQAAFNVIMSANPIALVVLAIVALVAIVILAYKHSQTFRDIVEGAWKGIQAVVKAVWNGFLKPVFGAFVQAFKDVGKFATVLWDGIKTVFNGIGKVIKGVWDITVKPIFTLMKAELGAVEWVAGLLWGGIKSGGKIVSDAFGVIKRAAGSVKDFVVGAFNGIAGAVGKVINFLIDGINFFIRAIDKIQMHVSVLGFHMNWDGFGIPEIPHVNLAAGGIVKARPGGLLALLGEGGHDEMVTPLGAGNRGGGSITIIINGPGNPAETARMVRAELLSLKRSGGIPTLGLA
jgi:hypothetical protein